MVKAATQLEHMVKELRLTLISEDLEIMFLEADEVKMGVMATHFPMQRALEGFDFSV